MNRIKNIIIILFLFIFTLFQFSFTDMISVSKDGFTISVDKDSGYFSFYKDIEEETRTGRIFTNTLPLLYEEDGATSFAQVYMNDRLVDYGSYKGDMKIKPYSVDNEIRSEWVYRNMTVRQILSFSTNEKGETDRLRVRYVIENGNRRKSEIGMRVFLDTQIGDEGTSVFLLPDGTEFTKENQLAGLALTNYWFAKSSENRFGVRGFMRTDRVTRPDKVLFTSFRKLVSSDWDVVPDYQSGFRNYGDGKVDSGVGMVFNPFEIDAKGENEIIIEYGFYKIEVASSEIFSADMILPEKASEMPIPVTVNVVNKGYRPIRELTMELQIPDQFQMASNELSSAFFGNIASGATNQVVWHLIPDEESLKKQVQLKITAEGLTSIATNQLTLEKELDIYMSNDVYLAYFESDNDTKADTSSSSDDTDNGGVEEIEEQPAYVLSEEEKKIMREIVILDQYIEEVDKQYQIMLNVYRNLNSDTNLISSDLDKIIQFYEKEVERQESILSNDRQLLE